MGFRLIQERQNFGITIANRDGGTMPCLGLSIWDWMTIMPMFSRREHITIMGYPQV